MVLFGKFKNAQKKIYDPEDDAVSRTKDDKNGYVEHECDLIVLVDKLRSGKIDNNGSKINKHHFAVCEMKIEKVKYQKDTKPITKDRVKNGEEPTPAQPLQEGQVKDYWITLPRFFHEDPDDYTLKELHQIGDLCDLIGAIFGVESEAVDLSELDEITPNDGADIQGTPFGVKYVETHYDAKDDKPARVYLNARPYPVDPETYERVAPMTAEEVAEAMSALE